MGSKEVTETLIAAQFYISSLQYLVDEIEKAEQQIELSAQEAEETIDNIFTSLLKNVNCMLEKRRNVLLAKTRKIKGDGLQPLKESHRIISDKIESATNLINLGKHILQGDAASKHDFNTKAALLGSLPQVPELKEVPYITFQCDHNSQTEIEELCSHLGTVFRIAPVQISQMTEKPGAILIEWESLDLDDRVTDIQEFRLQRAFGNVIKDKHLITNYKDCYNGPDTQFTVSDLQVNQSYSFRVCCKFEGCSSWSPWSLTQVSTTTLCPYSWQNNPDFLLFNDNRIAKPAKDNPSFLYSDGPQFHIGYSAEFTLLEFDTKPCLIGLIHTASPMQVKDLKMDTDHSFLIDECGSIFVDGSKRLTHLPKLNKYSKVTFSCELVNDEKIRMNVDSCNKRVTYEWGVPNDSKLYLAAFFESKDVEILVE